MFEHLPGKLRLKNNRNVNVFCNARFWEQGLAKLLYQRSCRSRLLNVDRLGSVELRLRKNAQPEGVSS